MGESDRKYEDDGSKDNGEEKEIRILRKVLTDEYFTKVMDVAEDCERFKAKVLNQTRCRDDGLN
jgi:hypothetical protein